MSFNLNWKIHVVFLCLTLKRFKVIAGAQEPFFICQSTNRNITLHLLSLANRNPDFLLETSGVSAEGDLYFTTKLQNYTAVEKDEVRLVCELSKAIADVKWFKDGKEITPSKNIAISTDGKKRMLMVRKAEKTNIGEYTCDCGSDKTTANLNIEGNPP